MVCPVCGRPVEQSGGRGRPKKYDRPDCQRIAQAAQRKANVERPRPPRVSTGKANPKKRRRALELIDEGHSLAEVATKAGLSPKTVRAIVRTPVPAGADGGGPPLPPLRLIPFEPSDEAARALEDFGYFRQRYFGRVPTPWQIEAAVSLRDYLAAPEKSFVVLNAPPGSGKSTLFVHDVLAWLACRDRSVRVLVGSRTYRQAVTHTARLRRTFSRVTLAPVDTDDVSRGLAVEPVSTLVKDFGRFQPLGRADQWAANEFVLVQSDGVAVSEKEASFAAYGMDSGFLGGRFDVVVWDDLVDSKTLKSPEGRDQLVRLYEDEMETRVEPGGLLLLQGQRMAADDLYRHCLNMRTGAPGDLEEDDRPAKYHHIVYRAHDDARCRGHETHGKDARAWPEGCLLDPLRLPWHELAAIRANRGEKFQVLYQQEDVDPANVLVPRIWIDGGRDVETGEQFPGCWDKERGIAEIPEGLAPPLYSIATADPSAAKFWAIQWWCVAEGTEVTTARGPVPIERVAISDQVLTRAGWRPVQHRTYMGDKPVKVILLSNGRTLRATADHLVLTVGGWLPVGALQPGLVLHCPPDVLGMGHGFEMADLDTGPVVAQVVDFEALGDSVPVEAQNSIGQPMGALFAEGVLAGRHDPVALRVSETVPFSAAGFGESASRVEVALVEFEAAPVADGLVSASHAHRRAGADLGAAGAVLVAVERPHPLGVGSVVARLAAFPSGAKDRVPAGALGVHVVSIHDGPTVAVYDIGVEGQHEFVAEGVVVHNCYHPGSEQRFLLDQVRQKMDAPEFLDFDYAAGVHIGVMEEWQARSQALGLPIVRWIVEANSAQRFLLQYDHVRTWQAKHKVSITAHQTQRNSLDKDYGVQSIAPNYRHGRVRLPAGGLGDQARRMSMPLVDEVTRYPDSATDDCVMAHWFLEWHLPRLFPKRVAMPTAARRPSWMKERGR